MISMGALRLINGFRYDGSFARAYWSRNSAYLRQSIPPPKLFGAGLPLISIAMNPSGLGKGHYGNDTFVFDLTTATRGNMAATKQMFGAKQRDWGRETD